MTLTEYQQHIKDLAKKTKHRWIKKDNGEVDFFVISHDFHNGPMCEVCNYSYCMHCDAPEEECNP